MVSLDETEIPFIVIVFNFLLILIEFEKHNKMIKILVSIKV